jgi:acetyltransferase-like isoleucine patch superfamily enzyme
VGVRRRLPGRRRAVSSDDDWAAFGAGSRIAEPILGVPHRAGIAVGVGVDIRAYAFLEALSPRGTVVISIGDGTYVGPFARITAIGGVTIGRRVLVADRCYISDTGHDYEDTTVPVVDQPLRLGRRVVIDDGAWLGVGVAVVGNVHIGRNAVVGANSVIREDVPAFSVVAGNPARIVRRWDGDEWRWSEPRP